MKSALITCFTLIAVCSAVEAQAGGRYYSYHSGYSHGYSDGHYRGYKRGYARGYSRGHYKGRGYHHRHYRHHRHRSDRRAGYLLGGIVIGSLLHHAYADRGRDYAPRRVERSYYSSSRQTRYSDSRRRYSYSDESTYSDQSSRYSSSNDDQSSRYIDGNSDQGSRYSSIKPEIVTHRDTPRPVAEHILLRDKEGRCFVVGEKENEQGESVEVRTEIEARACVE
ncbi:hypothetical protein FKG94_24225 [Exilibacterium tricleocarpae]|uniref:Uncharacterized protein n=1 Tax=Exilibacterium tricleocarpae TaxID=2591008 RepID=A0A545SSZ6_9GAMM|nr:hypothetical protein [Exilibacterium tricleocarpae]TQV68083.1 hypothetical protein FKG94_24225 [Exilibacterium tricleocarpae]